MMVNTKYGMNVSDVTLEGYRNKIKNQIYKLLPLREEGGQWKKFLDMLLIELNGADNLFEDTINFVSLLAKLEALKQEYDMKTHRKVVFECINMVDLLTQGDAHDRTDN